MVGEGVFLSNSFSLLLQHTMALEIPTQVLVGLLGACPSGTGQLTPQVSLVCIWQVMGGQEARGLSSLPAFLEAMIIGERASHWSRGLTSLLPPSPRPERLADPQVLVATFVTLFLVPKGGAQGPAWCSAPARNSDSEESPSQGGRRDLAE